MLATVLNAKMVLKLIHPTQQLNLVIYVKLKTVKVVIQTQLKDAKTVSQDIEFGLQMINL